MCDRTTDVDELLQGLTLQRWAGTLRAVESSRPHITVMCDPELSEALDRAAAIVGHDVPVERLVRDLAIRGADAVIAEAADRQAAEERLAALSSEADSGLFDREARVSTDQEAWRYTGDYE
jgi:hypothetical protein